MKDFKEKGKPDGTTSRTASTPSESLCSTVCSSPFTSPPISRPVSRRSSTSKSVRFARCTNASVFPTHSTTEYDRSPIVPTCEAQSLEIKRCKNDDDDGEWVQCQAREKAAAAAAGARLPKHAPAMENPVEGVHGLIEGAYFVGEERDDPAFPATTPACGSLGVSTVVSGASGGIVPVVVPPVIPFALGSLGFLTNFDIANYRETLNAAIDTGVRVNLRMRFTCTVYRAVTDDGSCKRRAVRSGKTGGIFMKSLTREGWDAIESGKPLGLSLIHI